MVLHLLIDTSTCLDLAKRRDGQRLIRPLQSLIEDGHVVLLVPQVIVEEFERNREGVEKTMTSSLTERIKAFRTELTAYAEMDYRDEELRQFDRWAHQVSLSGALTTRNFNDVRSLLDTGKRLEPTTGDQERVVARALAKRAPCHRQRNSVADALLVEMYTTAVGGAGPDDTYAFVTSNSTDFSTAQGDQREPHPDIAEAFAAEHSTYRLGVDGLEQCLRDEFGDYLDELIAEMYFPEDARGLDEILAAEKEFFDRIWYDRSMRHEQELLDAGDDAEVERLRKIAGPGRARVEATYGADNLGPYDKFEWGMLNGKLSALRWVLGDDWDFLDT
ncbi:PIN domain-containing protein [Mycobacterium sp. UM_CSW]|uniref:PIN domain-containing protein n=1 Tax=Mycobacterium sp. UM_CSW TaxID=1370119 RepID=UPI0003FD057C|nr:PIN domain-containing protein [Mycobacterium sp. UM_CSW]